MAVREFNGTSDRIVCDDGIIGQIANGAFTLFVLAKHLSPLTAGKTYISLQAGASQCCGMIDNGNVNIALGDDNDYVGGNVGQVVDQWFLYAITNTAPGATPKLHGKQRGAGSWLHPNAIGAFAGNTVDATTVEFASFNNGSFSSFMNMRLAVAAVWTSSLADVTLESIETTPATATIYALAPTSLWEFNQAAVGTSVTDLMGNGADQTVISGTTVINGDDPPGWTFGLGTEGAAGWVTTL
jgi:hypothetical protein